MKALVMETFGGTEVLKFADVPTPKPQNNEVLIKIHYAGVNPVDWKIREGHLKDRLPHQFPLIPGWDAAGVIAEVGGNVHDFKVGDAVYAYCRKPIVQEGTYAEYIGLDASQVAPLPKNINFAQGATVPLAALTAWQALFDLCHLEENQSVLVHAGAGGVGSFAIQFAKLKNATVYTTCSSVNFDYVKSLGADYVIDYTKENYFDVIKEKLDIVLDFIGGKAVEKSAPLLKPKGHLVSIVQAVDPEISRKYAIDGRYLFVRPNGTQLKEIGELIEKGKVKIPTITELPFKEAIKAQELSKTGHTQGKIVLKITD